MIHEEICTYEVAKLAKEKGFPQDVFGTCEMKSSCYLKDGRYYKDGCICPIEAAYTAPTQSLLQRWLREEKKIEVYIRNFEKTTDFPYHYWNLITDGNGKTLKVGDKMFDTYELALEDALKYALENLV